MDQGERHRHLRGGNGERPPQGRARMSMGGEEHLGHLRGGSGEVPHQGRAGMDCSQIEPPGHLLGGCGPPALQARAPHGAHGICADHRAFAGRARGMS